MAPRLIISAGNHWVVCLLTTYCSDNKALWSWAMKPVGRASHRYREVTGSSPVEVLNFFQASLRNCKNCVHNCEDHSSFDFISAVHIWFISYTSFTITRMLLKARTRNREREFRNEFSVAIRIVTKLKDKLFKAADCHFQVPRSSFPLLVTLFGLLQAQRHNCLND